MLEAIWGLQWKHFRRVNPHGTSISQHAVIEYMDEFGGSQGKLNFSFGSREEDELSIVERASAF